MKEFRYFLLFVAILFLGQFFVGAFVSAQAQPLRLMVAANVGGTTDRFGRLWAQNVSRSHHFNMNVVNGQPLRARRQMELLLNRVDAHAVVSWRLSAAGLNVLGLPFTFRTRAALAAFAKETLASLEVTSVKLLGFVPTGSKVMVAGKPINGPQDLQGLTLVDSGGLGAATMRTLKRKSITYATKRYNVMVSEGFQSQAIYSVPLLQLSPALYGNKRVVVSLTNHQFGGIWFGMRKAIFDRLTDEQAAAFDAATQRTIRTWNETESSRKTAFLESLKADGVRIHNPKALPGLFAALSPDANNTNGCVDGEYRAKVKKACKCVKGDKEDEC